MSDSLQLGLSLNFPQSELNKLDAIYNKIKKINDSLNNVSSNFSGTNNVQQIAKIQEKVTNEIDKGTKALNQTRKAAMGVGESIGHNVVKMAQWATSATLLYGTIRGLQSAFKTMVDLETNAVNILKVLPKGVSVQPFEQSAIKLAKEYGQSVLDVERSMQSLARQYKNVNDITNMTRASILATTATDIEFGESVKFLSSMMALWDLNTRQAIHTIDVLNEESNNFRTTATDLSSALMKTSSAARAVGLSFEEITGLATTAIQNLGLTFTFHFGSIETHLYFFSQFPLLPPPLSVKEAKFIK